MMQLHAPERDVPRDPAVLRLPPAALLVVAGVPGAGKTTLLSRIDAPGSLVLDPEPIRARLARRLGPIPYRLWRPLVHLLLLDVTAETALEGQGERRRTLGPAAFAAHWRQWRRLRGALPDPDGPGPAGAGVGAEGWASVRLLDRRAADRLGRVEIPAR